MNNREIQFVIKMRNEARQGLQSFGADLGKVVAGARKVAAQTLEASVAVETLGAEATKTRRSLGKMNAGLINARKNLKNASSAATGARRSISELTATAEASGAALGRVGRSVDRVGNSFRRHRKSAAGFFGVMEHGIKHMLGFTSAIAGFVMLEKAAHMYMSDVNDYQDLNGKLALQTSSPEELRQVRAEIIKSANASYSSVDDMGEAFYKGKMALGHSGYTDRDILTLARAINESNTISHATPQAAKFGTYELMQGIGAGTLNGREMRFLQQDSIRLAQTLADGLSKEFPAMAEKYGKKVLTGPDKGKYKIQTNQLKELASNGVLDAHSVARAIISQAPELDKQIAQLPMTARRTGVLLSNQRKASFGAFDAKNGISEGIVKGMRWLAMTGIPMITSGLQSIVNGVSPITSTIGAMISAFRSIVGSGAGMLSVFKGIGSVGLTVATTFATMFAASKIFGMGIRGVSKGIKGAIAGLKLLKVTMLANPFGILLFAVSAVVALFAVFKDKMITIGGATASLGSFVHAAWDQLVSVVKKAVSFIIDKASLAFKWYIKLEGKIFSGLFKGVAWLVQGVADAISSISGLVGNFIAHFDKSAGDAVKNAGKRASDFVKKFAGGIANGKSTVKKAVSDIANATKEALAHADVGGLGTAAEAYDKKKNTPHKTFDLLDTTHTEQVDTSERTPEAQIAKAGKAALSSLSSLSSAYDPVLSKQLQLAAAAQKYKRFMAMQSGTQAQQEGFAAALKASGLSRDDLSLLNYEGQNGLLRNDGSKFFSKFAGNRSAVNVGTDTFAANLEKVAKNATKSKEAMALYVKMLGHYNVTQSEANKALERYKNGVTNAQYKRAGAMLDDMAARNSMNVTMPKQTPEQLAAIQAQLNSGKYSQEQYAQWQSMDAARQGSNSSVMASAHAAGTDFIKSMSKNGTSMYTIFSQTFQGLTSMLTTFVQTGKLNFRSLLSTIVASITKMLAEKVVTKFLSMFGLGSDSSSSSSGSSGTSITSIASSLTSVLGFHSGGLAGGYSAWSRAVDPAVFAGAQRYHTGGLAGVKSGEVPLIAKKNEALMPTTRMSDGSFGVRVTGSTGNMNTVQFAPTIQINTSGSEGQSSEEHGNSIASALLPSLKSMVNDQIISQMRPGGLLNGGNSR